MEPAPAEVRTLPAGRAYFIDERDTLLRATWYQDRGFVNLSIWREDVCVATFHLALRDSTRLVSFLVEGLGEAVAGGEPSGPPPPRLAPAPPVPGVAEQLAGAARSFRRQLAAWISPEP